MRRRIREVLRDLGGTGKRETDRLRDELEVLRNEHSELKARLGKIEAAQAPHDGKPATTEGPAKPAPATPATTVKKGKKK